MILNSQLGPALILIIPFLLDFESQILKNHDFTKFRTVKNYLSKREEFDFIVGGGTGGSIVGGRLSENGKFKVLLLETGGVPPSSIYIPALSFISETSPSVNYLYESTPQKKFNNRRFISEQGKMLGGSHSHNRMVYNRGSPKDYDNWAKILKDESFKYKNLLRLFKKSESYHGHYPSDQHGEKGPIYIESVNNSLFKTWLRASEELEIDYGDANGPQKNGFSKVDSTTKNRRRFTTYNAFIEPYDGTRKNLRVLKYSEATKVHFKNKKAIGLTYIRHGVKFTAFAKREIILCGGSFGTPLLLFKSGVGPQKMLKEAGIKVVLDLPVGQSQQDQTGVKIKFQINDPSKISSLKFNLTQKSIDEYINYENEDILSHKGTNLQIFISSEIAIERGEENWADLHIYDSYDLKSQRSNEIFFSVLVTRPQFDDFSIEKLMLNTTAYKNGERDSVKLAVYEPKVLENQLDYQKLKYGIDFLLNFTKTKSFKELNTEVVPFDECFKKYKVISDDYWKCYVFESNFTFQLYHKCGTCQIGLKGKKYSVVDSKFRIHGLKNIRVVDASVLPRITNANINAAVMVLAEKASENIVNLYKI